MEEKKRRGYKTQEQQTAANKRWEERNPEAKEKNKISRLKSTAKRFIKEFSNSEDIKEFEKMLKERKGEIKMRRLDERAIKGLEFIKETGDYLVELESYEVSKLDGECMIDTWVCGYINKEDLGKLKSFVENETQILKGDFPKKVNVVIENEDGYEWVDVFYPEKN